MTSAAQPTKQPTNLSASPSNPAPRLPLPLRLVLVVVGMMVAALSPALVFLPLEGWLGTASPTTQTLVRIGAWLVALPVYVGVAWLLTRGIDRRPLREAGWRWDARSLPGLLAGTGLAVVLVVAALGALALVAPGVVTQVPAGALDGPLWLVLLALVARSFVLQGIGEELLWRGYGLATMRRRPVLALVVTTLVFGAMHLVSLGGQQNLADHLWYLAMPLGFAFLAGALALRMRSLWPAIGVHGGFHVGNAAAGALGLALDGPIAWVTVGVLFAAVGGLVLARTPRHLLAPGNEASPFDR